MLVPGFPKLRDCRQQKVLQMCYTKNNSIKSEVYNMKKEVKIYLVRHGQTLFNLLERVQGWSDTPLTTDGIEIAEFCGKGLSDIPFDRGYSSDLSRAKKTLEIMLNQNEYEIPNMVERIGLRELCFGDFEGGFDEERKVACSKVLLGELNMPLLREKLKSNEIHPRQMMNATASTDRSGYAETYETVQKRAVETMHEIAEELQKQGGGNILIVSHGVTISTILESFQGDQPEDMRTMKNASVSVIKYDNNSFFIEEAATMKYVEKGQKLESKR